MKPAVRLEMWECLHTWNLPNRLLFNVTYLWVLLRAPQMANNLPFICPFSPNALSLLKGKFRNKDFAVNNWFIYHPQCSGKNWQSQSCSKNANNKQKPLHVLNHEHPSYKSIYINSVPFPFCHVRQRVQIVYFSIGNPCNDC